jgi:hypothetical protein
MEEEQMKKILTSTLILIVGLFLLSGSTVSAQIDYCEGNFDYDNNQDGSDAFIFKTDFGRSIIRNPCPPDGPSPVPRTGQFHHSDGFGDDSYYQSGVEWPDPRFTDNSDGTVIDHLTGLIWLKNADCFGLRNWDDALSDCNGLADGQCGLTDSSNSSDWRLPNRQELLSLIDIESFAPAISIGHPFSNVQTNDYWTSSYYAPPRGRDWAWVVSFTSGDTDGERKTSTYYVWPVRGGRNTSRFKDSLNGTIMDHDSGLVWLKDANCFGNMNWYDAINAATNLGSGQCNLIDGSVTGDWRLPSEAEWNAFICPEYTNPALCNTAGTYQWWEGNPFNNVQNSIYWSATSLDQDNAWALLMWDGSGSFGHKSGSDCHVWPVREP